jgi:hypothetical protein
MSGCTRLKESPRKRRNFWHPLYQFGTIGEIKTFVERKNILDTIV